MKELDEETLEQLKSIKHYCLDLMLQLKQARTKKDLLEAGKILSSVNYSLLYLVKELEMDAINMIEESEDYIDVNIEEDNK